MTSARDEPTDERRMANILRRIELGDASVTDLVYWLQMQEDVQDARPSGPTPKPRSDG